MSQFRDLDGEFNPIKQYSATELEHDKFLLRLASERKHNKEQKLQKLNYTFNVRMPRKPFPVPTPIEGSSLSEQSHATEAKPRKRRVIKLGGTEELMKSLQRKNEAATKRRRIVLIPMSEADVKNAQKALHKDISSDEEFVDAVLQILEDQAEGSESPLLFVPDSDTEEVDDIFVPESGLAEIRLHLTPEFVADGAVEGLSEPNYLRADSNGSEGEKTHNNGNADESALNGREAGDESATNGMDDESATNGREDENERFKRNDENAIEGDEEANGNEEGSRTVLSEDIRLMKDIIMSQLNGLSFPLLDQSTLWEPYNEVFRLLDHTIRHSEGHTALLVGPHASGKTLIVERAILELSKTFEHEFITIRLSGSLHGDDKKAIREVARQLDSKLSKPSDGHTTFEQRAISDTFANILITLQQTDTGEKQDKLPIRMVFLIDEIEKFALTGKLTLLYNLFELSQSSKVPICIIGVTTQVTTRELFEKRVRSRFSQRIISTHRAPDLSTFWSNAKLALTVPESRYDDFADPQYPAEWNAHISNLYTYPSSLKKIVYRSFYTTKSYPEVYTGCLLPVALITEKNPFPRDKDFEVYMKNTSCKGIEAIIASMSNFEIALVIAAARWIEKFDTPHVNFMLAYKEYENMMKLFNKEATTLSSGTSHIDNVILAGIKVTHRIAPPKILRDSWAYIYRTGLLFDIVTSNNEVNANNNLNKYKEVVLDDSKMLQLDTTLAELGSLVDELNMFKRFTKL